MDQTKKISFGFSKLSKKPNVILNKTQNKSENDVQLIQCLEENSIKLINENIKPEAPLIIPVQQNRTTTAALASLRLRQAIITDEVDEAKNIVEESNDPTNSKNEKLLNVTDINESLEKKAARELLEEIQRGTTDEILKVNTTIAVPVKPDELPLDGAEEPKLDDYEKIPISQFGLAMLRGMGWKEEEKKKNEKLGDIDQPILRPRGMGLGADKVLKPKPALVPPEKNEKLEIKKKAYVRILGGKHKDLYGQIEGLDDRGGRVIVKLAIGGSSESLNEFLVQPVSKGEYTKYGKVINSAKYEEYKKLQETEEQKRIQIKQKRDLKIEDDDNEKPETKHEIDIKNIKKEIKTEKSNKYDYDNKNNIGSSRDHNFEEKNKSHHNNEKDIHRHIHRREQDKSSRHERHNSSRSSSRSCSEYRRSKKKSKSKKDRNERYYNNSSEDDRRHKKKTKKSKKARSRSRGRR